MKISILTQEQKKEAESLQKNYPYVYVCSECNRIYGSDLKDNTKLCPFHIKKGDNFKK
jgi:hypothetical protein